jgi:hypothetical protein
VSATMAHDFQGTATSAADAPVTPPPVTSTETRQNHDQAVRFLLLLDKYAERFTFQTFTDCKARRNNGRKNRQGDPLARVLQGTLEQHWCELCKLNNRGAGVYVTVNETDGNGRTADNIIRVRAVFEEQDTPNKPPATYPLEPNLVVESSPGKFHRYWFVDGLDLGEWEGIQAGIAERYQGDPSAAEGVNRVMRLPGFFHNKNPAAPHLVTITRESGGQPYAAEDIRAAFPPPPNTDAGEKEKPKLGIEHSDILKELNRRGHLRGANPGGGWVILCPWHSAHTTGNDGTAYWEPHTGGYAGHGFKCQHSHCTKRTADDLLEWLGMEGKAVGWPEPQMLTAKVESEAYPLDALPESIRAAVQEVQRFIQSPIPLVASSALAALSVACQSHIDIKRADKLVGPSSLFLLSIADSGERKSTCDGFFVSGIRQFQDEQVEALKPELDLHKVEIDAWTAQRDGLLSAIKEAAKKGKATDQLRSDLAELQWKKPEAPKVPRLLLGDETPENLAWSLARQWPSAGVLSSEAALIFGAHGMGKDSVMRNLGLLNVLWDGGAHSVGRRTSECFTVKGARLTVALQIQEATLQAFFERSGGLARGTGFLARFLVAWPESTQGYRPFTEAPPNWPHLAAFHRRIAAILGNPVPMNDDGTLSPAMLTLSPEAKAAWVAFHDAIEGELRSGGELYDVRDVASKTADNAARLAALFQIFEHGMGSAVGLQAFEGASRIAAWHLSESRRFFGELSLPEGLADAVRLDAWLIGHCRATRTRLVPTREALRLGPGCVRTKGRLAAALQQLEELDRVRVTQEGRRKTVEVNPFLLGMEP